MVRYEIFCYDDSLKLVSSHNTSSSLWQNQIKDDIWKDDYLKPCMLYFVFLFFFAFTSFTIIICLFNQTELALA